MRCLALLLSGCLFAPEVYQARLDELDDDDADGWSSDAGDCDDTDPDRFPGADERCDEADNDCDGDVDEGITDVTGYADADGDGFGDLLTPLAGCTPSGVADSSDCDDTDASVFPGADETCDGRDEDCDRALDNDSVDATAGFQDADGDGFGDPAAPAIRCDTAGLVANDDDCDDTRDWVFPGAPERIDGVTNDCESGGAADQVTLASVSAVRTGPSGFGQTVSVRSPFDRVAIGAADHAYLFADPFLAGDQQGATLSLSGVTGAPLLADDLDGDGADEVVVPVEGGFALVDVDSTGTLAPGPTRAGAIAPLAASEAWLICSTNDGANGWRAPLPGNASWSLSGGSPASAAALLDADGDGADEVWLGFADTGVVLGWNLSGGAHTAANADFSVRASQPDGGFGNTLAAVSDSDGDGTAELLVGAPGWAGTGARDGAVFQFLSFAGSQTEAEASGSVSGKGAPSLAGSALAVVPQLRDGSAAVWVGQPAQPDYEGRVALFALPLVGAVAYRDNLAEFVGPSASDAGAALAWWAPEGSEAGLLIGDPANAAVYTFAARLD